MRPWIDAHLHLWDPTRMRYPWLDGEPSLNRGYQMGDLDPADHDLGGVVMVEAGRVEDAALEEVEWVAELAARDRRIMAMVAHAPVERGEGVRPQLLELSGHPLVTGVRRNVQDEAPGFALGEDFVRGVRLLADYGYPFDLCVRHHQLPEVTELVARVPDVTFVLDHLGKPAVADGAQQPWRDHLSRLAAHPNVVCKLSGLATEADPRWRFDDVAPYLLHALAEFGPDRTMFGGDWPVSTLATSYGRWIDTVGAVIADRSPAERNAVISGTARRVYGLPGE